MRYSSFNLLVLHTSYILYNFNLSGQGRPDENGTDYPRIEFGKGKKKISKKRAVRKMPYKRNKSASFHQNDT
jgi:hypothetical protein